MSSSGGTNMRRGIFPAAFVDVVSASSACRPGLVGDIRCLRRWTPALAMGAAGIGGGRVRGCLRALGGAERLLRFLRHFGHEGCGLIELESWRGPLTSGEETAELASFEPERRADDTIELDELVSRRRELVVVDARLPSRFRGEPNPVARLPGRISGCQVNAPWPEQPPELPAGELIAYCGSGVTACVSLHRLHLAGREGRLYLGSLVGVGSSIHELLVRIRVRPRKTLCVRLHVAVDDPAVTNDDGEGLPGRIRLRESDSVRAEVGRRGSGSRRGRSEGGLQVVQKRFGGLVADLSASVRSGRRAPGPARRHGWRSRCGPSR